MGKMRITDIPEHVSWQVQDAWLCIPPCMYTEPYCHIDCPYFSDCNPPEEESDDMELYHEYYSQTNKQQ